MTVNIARCPTHGLHGERTHCFICGEPVEQVAMVPPEDIERIRHALEYLADPSNWLGDPHDQTAILLGADTPFELAAEALGRAA